MIDSETRMATETGATAMADFREVSLEALYDQYARSMYRLALAILGSADDAEDAVQEVFVRVARQMKRLRKVESIKSYLLTATRNAAYGILRTKRRREVLHDAICAEFRSCSADVEDGAPIDPAALCHALAELPAEQREVLVLKVYDEMTLKEIADTVGVSINTISSRYRYGIARLRQVVEGYDNG